MPPEQNSVATDPFASPLSKPSTLVIPLDSGTIYRRLLTLIAALAVLSTLAKGVMLTLPAEQFGAVHELCKRFYFDFENNVPAWCSTLGLFTASGLFALIARSERVRRSNHPWHWIGLSLLFVGMAIDEATYMHEILIVSLRNALNLSGIFYFAWVIPGSLFVVAFGILYWPFVRRLPKATRWGLILAGSLYVGGALGMELLGGLFAEAYGFDAASYVAVMTIEESLEMVGIATLNVVLLRHLAHIVPDALRLQFH